VRLTGVEVRLVVLELAEPLVAAHATVRERPLVLVRVLTDAAEGWGECAALAEPTYTAEYAAGAFAVLVDHLVPRLLAPRPPASVQEALARLEQVVGHPMAKAAIEMALLDAGLRAEGRSLAEHLGAVERRVVAGATIGLGAPAQVLAAADAAVAAGYRRLKCKIAPGREWALLEGVRARHPEVALVADANGSYRLGDPRQRRALERLDRLGLAALEQPLAPDDLLGHAELTASLETPVVLDESVTSLGVLDSAIALRACRGVVVKPARLGGLLAARRVHARCVEAGLALALGGMLESGLGRAATLAVGGLGGFSLGSDLGASDRYFATDLTEAHRLEGGWLEVPAGPGLGVAPVPERLQAAQLRSWSARPAP